MEKGHPVRVSIRIKPEQAVFLRQLAEQDEVNISSIIRRAINRFQREAEKGE